MRLPRSYPAVFALFAALLVASPAAAQETQVALDDSGRLLEIDRPLAQRLDLFLAEYPDLEVVRLFELADGSFILEVSRRVEGQVVRQRVPLTAAEATGLRSRVSAALARLAPEVMLDQDGRYLLLGTTTLLGLGYYGWAVPAVLDLDTGRGVLAAYMLTAGASFVLPYLYTKNRPVTYGMANAAFWGATRGIAHGVYLANLVDGTPSGEAQLGLGMGASLAEGLVAYNWARDADMSAGRAHTIGNFGDFGHAWTGAGLLMAQPEAEQPGGSSASEPPSSSPRMTQTTPPPFSPSPLSAPTPGSWPPSPASPTTPAVAPSGAPAPSSWT